MTIKEAVNTIAHFCDYIIPCDEYGYRIRDELVEAHTMAVRALQGQGWIPVTERLPEDDLPKCSKKKQIKVLTALISDKGVRTVRSQMRYRCTWYYDSAPWAWKYSGSEITHWMPLPEPPKEDSDAV